MSAVTPREFADEIDRGALRPVYLFAGEERYLVDRAVRALRDRALAGAVADFNEDVLLADEAGIDRVLAAARTMPMMAERRFVLVRQVERWDQGEAQALDKLAKFAEAPSPSTCLALVATKIDARRRFSSLAKKQGFLVACDPLPDEKLPGFVAARAKERGVKVRDDVARLLATLVGPDLAALVDAVERLSLFVGEGAEITEDAVGAIIVKVRETSAFSLIDAVGRRDRRKALALLHEVLDEREGPKLLGLFAWSARQLLKFKAALEAGDAPDAAAKSAGVPPFKARELAQRVRPLPREELERWLVLLAEADLQLKGGKRPTGAVFETLILDLASRGPA